MHSPMRRRTANLSPNASNHLRMNVKRWIVWAAVVAVALAGVAILIARMHRWRPRTIVLQGAVLRAEEDPNARRPITGATVTATDGVVTQSAQSDASGYFVVRLNEAVWPGQTIRLHFSSEGYTPMDMSIPMGLHLAA